MRSGRTATETQSRGDCDYDDFKDGDGICTIVILRMTILMINIVILNMIILMIIIVLLKMIILMIIIVMMKKITGLSIRLVRRLRPTAPSFP